MANADTESNLPEPSAPTATSSFVLIVRHCHACLFFSRRNVPRLLIQLHSLPPCISSRFATKEIFLHQLSVRRPLIHACTPPSHAILRFAAYMMNTFYGLSEADPNAHDVTLKHSESLYNAICHTLLLSFCTPSPLTYPLLRHVTPVTPTSVPPPPPASLLRCRKFTRRIYMCELT
jgi:hypothetical protein